MAGVVQSLRLQFACLTQVEVGAVPAFVADPDQGVLSTVVAGHGAMNGLQYRGSGTSSLRGGEGRGGSELSFDIISIDSLFG